MQFFDSLRTTISNLDEKKWYTYLGITLGICLLLIGGIIYYYYSSASSLKERAAYVNEEREKARKILTDAQRVAKQRAEVNAMLEEEPDFKIKGYLQEVMTHIGIIRNLTSENDTTIDREDNFRENIVSYQFTGTTMRQLTELLSEIEQNPRLYTKDLEIAKSKKIPNTIDVGITVATMIPKPK